MKYLCPIQVVYVYVLNRICFSYTGKFCTYSFIVVFNFGEERSGELMQKLRQLNRNR